MASSMCFSVLQVTFSTVLISFLFSFFVLFLFFSFLLLLLAHKSKIFLERAQASVDAAVMRDAALDCLLELVRNGGGGAIARASNA